MNWRSFIQTLVAVATLGAAALYAGIAMIDPYDTIRYAPPLERAPTAANQRFAFPALARKVAFDSAIIGTSTTRLLRPRDLDPLFGARFVNLSMNSATAWEQSQILAVFLRDKARIDTVIFGVDVVWCATGDTFEKLTPRPFPDWMYDANPWNDLVHLFNFPTLQEAGRQLAHLTGIRRSRNGIDGYTNFLPDPAEYDLARARQHLYGTSEPRPRPAGDPAEIARLAAAGGWKFPTHDLFEEMLAGIAPSTRIIVVFVPYHIASQGDGSDADAARWLACKQAIGRVVGRHPNAIALDFMIPSAITRRDENYWDPLHYTLDVATEVARLIAEGARTGQSEPDRFDVLVAPGAK